jgi:hypothetical protein
VSLYGFLQAEGSTDAVGDARRAGRQKTNNGEIEMQIPKSVMVGKKKYYIHLQRSAKRNAWGCIYFLVPSIYISTHSEGKPRPAAGRDGMNTIFWHEIMHAILHDMNHPLNKDEQFVTEVSRRLAQVCETAKMG